MADFIKFAPLLLQLEGGFSYNRYDKGGPTNMGVTLKTYQAYCGEDKNAADLKQMSYGVWRGIMKDMYWDKCRADEIRSQSLAEIIVDWHVNSGLVAIRKVQEIAGVKPDGIFGPATLSAVNSHNPHELFDRILAARKQFFVNIVKRAPNQKIFMNGWMNRLNSFVFEE
ncbi:MAG: glycoside hydrolase family 108 protein [Candidatus Cryptobacteroides sp.]